MEDKLMDIMDTYAKKRDLGTAGYIEDYVIRYLVEYAEHGDVGNLVAAKVAAEKLVKYLRGEVYA